MWIFSNRSIHLFSTLLEKSTKYNKASSNSLKTSAVMQPLEKQRSSGDGGGGGYIPLSHIHYHTARNKS